MGTEFVHVYVPRGLWGEKRDQCLLELLDGWGHLDVLAFLQPLLTLNQVVDAINHRLHQLDLREGYTTFNDVVKFCTRKIKPPKKCPYKFKCV